MTPIEIGRAVTAVLIAALSPLATYVAGDTSLRGAMILGLLGGLSTLHNLFTPGPTRRELPAGEPAKEPVP